MNDGGHGKDKMDSAPASPTNQISNDPALWTSLSKKDRDTIALILQSFNSCRPSKGFKESHLSNVSVHRSITKWGETEERLACME